jgi:predicted extracellular nuclease
MSTIGHSHLRRLLWLLAGLVFTVTLIDLGSVTIARLQVDEDAKSAARFAVQQIQGEPITQATAQVAYNAAALALPNDTEAVVIDAPGTDQDFRLNADGSITLTVTRRAPTLAFGYLPYLKELPNVAVTYTQQKLGM